MLKQKGKTAKTTPKAGPKKKRAKTEEEMIRSAVDEHGKRGVRVARKSSKVNIIKYKEAETAKRKRADKFQREQELAHGLREPQGPNAFDQFVAELDTSQRVFAKTYWQMQCEHKHEESVAESVSFVEGREPIFVRCFDCGANRRWMGTRTATKINEWMSYCPDGYDMFEWEELFVKDRSMWRFIHDEAMYEMVEAAMTTDEEEAA